MELFRDVRYGVRQLWRAPGFTAAAVLALGLGVGATTAIFSVLDAVVLRPLPYAQPERLVTLREANAAKGLDREPMSPVNFVDYRALNQVFEWIQEKPLRVAGYGYMVSTLCHAGSTAVAYYDAKKRGEAQLNDTVDSPKRERADHSHESEYSKRDSLAQLGACAGFLFTARAPAWEA